MSIHIFPSRGFHVYGASQRKNVFILVSHMPTLDIRGKRQYAVHFLALFPFVENINYLCYLYVLSKCHWSQRLKPNHDTCTIEGTHGTHITFERFSSLVILIECLAQINRSFQIYSRRKITVKGKDLELTLKHIHLKKCFLDSR